ncbi:MAG: protein kinase, partial [Bacteroidota bacterium]
MLNIPGYQVSEEIYRGPQTVAYRGLRKSDEMPVVIKTSQKRNPAIWTMSSFQNESQLTEHLDIDGVPAHLDFIRLENRPVIVMADDGAMSLREYMRHHEMDTPAFLTFALRLARILQQVHARNIIHKDIKPDN